MDGADQSRPIGQYGDWYASHDHMPPGPATLRVIGKCRFRTTGYKVELRRREPNPWHPNDLLLELIVEEPPPGSIVGPGFTTLEARYEEETDAEYETVTILSDSVTVPVEDVQ
jgi:hypothetical protein